MYTKKILLILLLIPMFSVGQGQNPYKFQDIKEIQFEIVAPTMYLMELYMMDTKNDSIEVWGRNGMNTWVKEPRPKTFEDFYYWTKEYFREQLKEEE
jgi:hypothetical protein